MLVQLQRAMAAEAEAAREARAKVVAAEGNHKASIHLKDAALSALQLRYLQVKIGNSFEIIFNCLFQTLNAISIKQSSTIVFPFPIEMLCLSMGSDKDKKKAD